MKRARKADGLIPALGWIGAAGVVAGAHVAIALAFAARPVEGVLGAAAPAIMIDLQPIAVPPEPTPPPAPDVAPEPPRPDPTPPPVAEVPAQEPPPEVTPPPEPTPAPLPEPVPEIKLPEAPVKAEAVLPPPPPLSPQEPPPPKPVPQHKPKLKRDIEHRELKRPERTAAPQPVAPPAATPQSSAAAVASARAEWQRAMQSHIARFKRSASGSGRATVTFTISRDGQVMSARLASSSGKADLDAEAVAMVERASPMPSPPPELPGRAITLTIPITYR
jgi:protein TonB